MVLTNLEIKPGYFMAGKTATSQVRRITMREREELLKIRICLEK